MERIVYNSRSSIQLVRGTGEGRVRYVVTQPIRFYVTELPQLLMRVERGFHIYETDIPWPLRKLLKPDGNLGVVAAVFCKLMEHPYVFDEITQREVEYDAERVNAIVLSVLDQFGVGAIQKTVARTVLTAWTALNLERGGSPSQRKVEEEREWRKENPVHFVSVR